MKHLYLLIFVLIIYSSKLFAQTTHKDSVAEIAKADTKNFMLSKADLEEYNKLGAKKRSSDYFEPKVADVSDVRLLKDPDYVKAYRDFAFMKTRKKHTVGHYLLIVGSSIVGLLVIAIIIYAASGGIGSFTEI